MKRALSNIWYYVCTLLKAARGLNHNIVISRSGCNKPTNNAETKGRARQRNRTSIDQANPNAKRPEGRGTQNSDAHTAKNIYSTIVRISATAGQKTRCTYARHLKKESVLQPKNRTANTKGKRTQQSIYVERNTELQIPSGIRSPYIPGTTYQGIW